MSSKNNLMSRPPLRSREIAMAYSGWETDELKRRFFDNLVIKVGGIKGVPYGIYVYICYKDTPLEEGQFADVPFFEKSDDGNLIVTGFRARSVPIRKDTPPQSGIPIRTHFTREINDFIPVKKIERLISILRREWGSEVPVKNNTRYVAIRYRDRDERAENNRIIFSSLLQSTGLSLKSASQLFQIREDSLRKFLDGKAPVPDSLVERGERLESEIQYYVNTISEKIRKEKGDEIDIAISETDYGRAISVAYGIDAPCEFSINGKKIRETNKCDGGDWSIPIFRCIIGRIIGMTNKKLNIKEVPWSP